MTRKTDRILTKIESQVASCYACGMVGKEVARSVGISYNTVVRHTQKIYDKTGIPRCTNALAAWFLSQNFDIDMEEIRREVTK